MVINNNPPTEKSTSSKGKKTPKVKTPKLKRFATIESVEELEVRLNDTEVAEKGMVYARLHQERENLIAERKSVMDACKAQITAKAEEIEEVGHILLSREEKRRVPCTIQFDTKLNVKTWFRRGSKKVVKGPEPMTPAEVREHQQGKLIVMPAPVVKPDEPLAPLGSAAAKDGDATSDPERTNPTNVEEVNFVDDGRTGGDGAPAA